MKEMPPEGVSLSSMRESGRFIRISGLARNLARVGNPQDQAVPSYCLGSSVSRDQRAAALPTKGLSEERTR